MTPRNADNPRDEPSGAEPVSAPIDTRDTAAPDPIQLPYAPRPERVMIEQIEIVRRGSWDFVVGVIVACAFGSLAFNAQGFWQAVFVVMLIAPLIPLLRGRTTRTIGIGWLTGLVLMLVGYAILAWLFLGRPFNLPVSWTS